MATTSLVGTFRRAGDLIPGASANASSSRNNSYQHATTLLQDSPVKDHVNALNSSYRGAKQSLIHLKNLFPLSTTSETGGAGAGAGGAAPGPLRNTSKSTPTRNNNRQPNVASEISHPHLHHISPLSHSAQLVRDRLGDHYDHEEQHCSAATTLYPPGAGVTGEITKSGEAGAAAALPPTAGAAPPMLSPTNAVDRRVASHLQEIADAQELAENKTRKNLRARSVEIAAGGKAADRRGRERMGAGRRSTSLLDVGGYATHIPCSYTDPGIDEAVAHLERMIGQNVHQHQVSSDVYLAIRTLLADRPEWRQRLAEKTSSAILRQAILLSQAPGARMAGSAVPGATHLWRCAAANENGYLPLRIPKYARGESNLYTSDHNWPEVDPIRGQLSRSNVIASPAERMRYDPTKTASVRYSVGKERREANEPIKSKNSDPGPGHYGQFSIPQGLPLTVGEQVLLGANHTFQFKRILAADHCVFKHRCVPVFSFPKSRRTINEVQLGKYACVNARKTDAGPLSPGPVYEHYTTFHPKQQVVLNTRPGRAKSLRLLQKKE